MVKKYVFGEPIETEAVVVGIKAADDQPAIGKIKINTKSKEKGFTFTLKLGAGDKVYGLGENVRGINKRGYVYCSRATDVSPHTEDVSSLYAAHNFMVIAGKKITGLFFDYPAKITFDIGYTKRDYLEVSCKHADLYLYVIDGESVLDVIKQFRKIIGRSYIPPKWGMGFGQSRYGYKSEADIREVFDGYKKNHVPIDMIYMDIDYMDHFKDFTVNKENFPDFKAFATELKKSNVRLIPIVDAAIKEEAGFDVYEEGKKKGYYCKDEDGNDFIGYVWPGRSAFTDVLRPEARLWFGEKYKFYLDNGIEGFWNDMNEPAIFVTEKGKEKFCKFAEKYAKKKGDMDVFEVMENVGKFMHNPDYHKEFYHVMNGKKVNHDDVHNLYGYNMTRGASEGFKKLAPGKRILLFSRSSYIGSHRYGGIWTGDNMSWWTDLLMNLKMMPSLNMCGYLYAGADLGGFGSDTSRDLLLRWLAFGVFTPLMRNHTSMGTRQQEVFRFEDIDDFAHVIGVRYRLLPYLYSEYMKAALNDDMYFKALAFEYPKDERAVEVEDQLMLGNDVMVAPVYVQNATGRMVYLPEDMLFVKFKKDGSIYTEEMSKGDHYIKVALNEVPLFIKRNHVIPVGEFAECVADIDYGKLKEIGWTDREVHYDLYNDDGVTTI